MICLTTLAALITAMSWTIDKHAIKDPVLSLLHNSYQVVDRDARNGDDLVGENDDDDSAIET